MSVKNKMMGIGLMIAGAAIWYIDYFILKAIASIGTWLAELMNAPAGVGTGITILIAIPLLGVFIFVIVVGAIPFWWGLCAMEKK